MNEEQVDEVFTIIFFYYSSFLFAQNEPGAPFIRNYLPKEYKSSSQNWAIIQDNRGVIYFGNSSGILEFDGKKWRLIEVSNKSVVRSLAKDNKGIIYVRASSEFGYLASDASGLLKYISLKMKTHCWHRVMKEFTRLLIL